MKQQIIYVPGLGDQNSGSQKRILKSWHWFGTRVHFMQVNWFDNEPFESKLKRLLETVDKLANQGSVSLIGVSAGASLALAAYSLRKDNISSVVFICGKLQNPGGVNESYFRKNPAFRESVFSTPDNLANLTDVDKAKMQTIHAFIDTVVPVRDSKIAGVRDKTIPAIGHVVSISLAITLYAKSITAFIKKCAPKT